MHWLLEAFALTGDSQYSLSGEEKNDYFVWDSPVVSHENMNNI